MASKHWARALALLALIPLTLVGCKDSSQGGSGSASGGSGGDGNTVKIAVCGPMTGTGAAFGEQIRLAAKLKEKQVNEAGGITVDGKKMMVEFVVEDDEGKAQSATSVAAKVGPDKSISAVVGHFNSDCSLAAKEKYKRYEIVAISPGSTNVAVCQGSDWFFRNLYRDDQQGAFLARFAKEALGFDKVAVIYEEDNYGKGLKNSFEAKAKEIGLEVVALETYQRGRTQDFSPHLDKVKASGAKGVFISGLFNEAALIIKTAKNDKGMGDVTFFGGDGLASQDLIKTAGKTAEGLYVTTPFLFGTGTESEAAKKFAADFKAFSEGKDPDTWAALTWDACGQLLAAIEAVGTDRKKIREHLAAQTSKEKGFGGITGVTYFDKNGDCVGKPIYVTVVKDGKFDVSPKQLLK